MGETVTKILLPIGAHNKKGYGRLQQGIAISYAKETQTIDIYGWFDGFCGIEGGTMMLKDFLTALQITPDDFSDIWKDE